MKPCSPCSKEKDCEACLKAMKDSLLRIDENGDIPGFWDAISAHITCKECSK